MSLIASPYVKQCMLCNDAREKRIWTKTRVLLSQPPSFKYGRRSLVCDSMCMTWWYHAKKLSYFGKLGFLFKEVTLSNFSCCILVKENARGFSYFLNIINSFVAFSSKVVAVPLLYFMTRQTQTKRDFYLSKFCMCTLMDTRGQHSTYSTFPLVLDQPVRKIFMLTTTNPLP